MAIRLEHISVLVRNCDEAVARWKTIFGVAEHRDVGVVAHEGVKCAKFAVGGVDLEFIEPIAPGPQARALQARGEGVHHLSFTIDNVDNDIQRLLSQEFQLVNTNPRTVVGPQYSVGGSRYFFVHPRSANGVLIEFNSKDPKKPTA